MVFFNIKSDILVIKIYILFEHLSSLNKAVTEEKILVSCYSIKLPTIIDKY